MNTQGIPTNVCFSNSNYLGDPVTRKSIRGFVLYVLGVPFSWQSRVSLYSSKAEYLALSEAVKEVMLVIQVLGSTKILIEYPVMVRVENVGAIFMASNITTTSFIKHMDIRYKNVNEYFKDGAIKIIFVKSAYNDSDILTKNLSSELCKKHSNNCAEITSNILFENIFMTRVSLT